MVARLQILTILCGVVLLSFATTGTAAAECEVAPEPPTEK
jgi:hypothetical protein